MYCWDLYFLVNTCTLACFPECVHKKCTLQCGNSLSVAPPALLYREFTLPIQLHGSISYAVKDRLIIRSNLSWINYFFGGIRMSSSPATGPPPLMKFSSLSWIMSFANALKFAVFMISQLGVKHLFVFVFIC